MNSTKITGIIPALMAAFNDDGIDTAKVAALVQRLKADGVHGLYVGGSSAEMVLQSENERKTLLECAVDAAEGLPIIAHVGAMSTKETVSLARHARGCGADAVSSVTPFYFAYSFAEVKHFYERIAEASELPVIIYNIPARTGSAFGYEQLCELLELPGIGGMKFTSTDFYTLSRLTQTFPDKVFYNGCDEALLQGLTAGAAGGIGTTYNYMPDLYLGIYRAYCEGDIKTAKKLQELSVAIIAASIKYGIPGCKVMLEYCGLPYGECREPFLPVSSEGRKEILEKAYPPLCNWRAGK